MRARGAIFKNDDHSRPKRATISNKLHPHASWYSNVIIPSCIIYVEKFFAIRAVLPGATICVRFSSQKD